MEDHPPVSSRWTPTCPPRPTCHPHLGPPCGLGRSVPNSARLGGPRSSRRPGRGGSRRTAPCVALFSNIHLGMQGANPLNPGAWRIFFKGVKGVFAGRPLFQATAGLECNIEEGAQCPKILEPLYIYNHIYTKGPQRGLEFGGWVLAVHSRLNHIPVKIKLHRTIHQRDQRAHPPATSMGILEFLCKQRSTGLKNWLRKRKDR